MKVLLAILKHLRMANLKAAKVLKTGKNIPTLYRKNLHNLRGARLDGDNLLQAKQNIQAPYLVKVFQVRCLQALLLIWMVVLRILKLNVRSMTYWTKRQFAYFKQHQGGYQASKKEFL